MSLSVRSMSICNDTLDTSYSASTITTGEQEYETQFLGFSPKSMCDGLYNAVQEYTWEYFMASQKYIKAEFGDLVTREELQNASHVFLTAVSQQIDKAFDKFERYTLDNILKIPPDVVLPEDRIQQEYINFSKASQQILADEICTLKERIIAAKCVNASVRQEYAQAKYVHEKHTHFLEILRAMDRALKTAGVHDVHESLKYTVEKSNNILSLLNQLQKYTSGVKRPLPQLSELDQLTKRLKADTEPIVETQNSSSETTDSSPN